MTPKDLLRELELLLAENRRQSWPNGLLVGPSVGWALSGATEFVRIAALLEDLTPFDEVTMGAREEQARITLSMLEEAQSMEFAVELSAKWVNANLVDRARALGATWQEIGAAWGMSAQGAHKRAAAMGAESGSASTE